MKKLYICLTLISQSVLSQIVNPGFESNRDTLPELPAGWKAKPIEGYSWKTEAINAHSGKQALMISNQTNLDTLKFSPFSQKCAMEITKAKKLLLTAYIKTENVSKNAGLWCQLWNKNDESIGFASLQTQHTIIKGTTSWTKYSVTLVVNPDIKKLLVGGFLSGTGSVWYDDFKIEENENQSPVDKKAIKYIDEVVKVAEKNSIVSDSINWKTTKEDMYSLAGGAKTTSDCYESVNYLLSVLRKKGDIHSGFYPPELNEKNESSNLDGRQPNGKYLGNATGYIYVPGILSANNKIGIDFATQIQSIIKSIDSADHINNWIVDLRENTGGNMYPMIAGLGPILGEGTLGYFYSPKSKAEYSWHYKNGASGAGIAAICKVEHAYHLKNAKPHIAVLIGPETGSSGEMTLISFIGKENTTLIGMATAGYSTGNAGHKLSDGSVLNLCESYCRDRNKKAYFGKINPDELITGYTEGQDAAIEYAKKQFPK